MDGNTWLYDDICFDKCTLTEILVVPDLNIHIKMIEISRQFLNSYFLDTVGNLKIYNEFYNLKLNVTYTTSLRSFYKYLSRLKALDNAVLFIDNIAFLSDKNIPIYNSIYNVLWHIIYKYKCTVVVSNQYRFIRDKSKYLFVPRLGKLWSKIITNRIFYKYKSSKLIYEYQKSLT